MLVLCSKDCKDTKNTEKILKSSDNLIPKSLLKNVCLIRAGEFTNSTKMIEIAESIKIADT